MDFHTLTRKELQTLCKKNKIPANITNVAMADGLAALEFVEGLDELMDQPHSPEKTSVTESATMRTANRTSTRRKPIKEDPETVQPMTRTRRATMKMLDKDLDQENNVGETSVVKDNAASRRKASAASASKKMGTQVKDNVGKEMSSGVEFETPMVQSGRRKAAQVGSTRRKLEEESVQRVYSTRRSVRLLEKTLADLSLKDEVKEEPVKMMDVLDETEEKDVSEVSSETNKDSEFSSGVSFLKSLENERKSEEVYEDKTNENGEEDCNVATQNSVNSDNVSVLDGENDNHDETCDTSDELPVKNSNVIEPVDIPKTESTYETENISTIKVMETEESLDAEESDKISAQVVEDVVPEDHFENSGKSSEADTNQSVNKQLIEPEEPPAADESDKISAHVVEDVVPEDQFIHSGRNSQADTKHSVTNFASPSNKQFTVECVETESVHMDNVVATYNSDGPNVETDNVVAINSSYQDITNSNANPLNLQVPVECVLNMQVPFECDEDESFHLDNIMVTNSFNGPHVETDDELESDNATYSSDNPNVETDDELDSDNDAAAYSFDDRNDETDNEVSSDDELVDVQLTEVEVPISSVEGSVVVNLIEAEIPASDGIKEEFDADKTKETEVAFENKTPKSVKQIDSISKEKTPEYRPMSPFGADSISGQFPRPTQSRPKRSSSKKHATAQKLTLLEYNKENDSSGLQLEPNKDKAMKHKNLTDEDSLVKSLQKKSLRKLNKMLREKLTITNKNKNNEGTNVARTRPALQSLPENVLATADPNKGN